MKQYTKLAISFGLGATTLVVVSSCAVNPKATIRPVSTMQDVIDNSSNASSLFYLRGSKLNISVQPEQTGRSKEGKGNDSKGQSSGKLNLTVTPSLIEDRSSRFVLLQNSDLLSRTKLNVSKLENTDLISEVGVEVTDNRENLIKNLGSIAKTGIGFLVSGSGTAPSEEAKKGFQFDFDTVNRIVPGLQCKTDDGMPCPTTGDGSFVTDITGTWTGENYTNFKIEVSPPPITSMPVGRTTNGKPDLTSLGQILTPNIGGIFHSSCRPVTVTYGQQKWSGKVADSTFIEYTPLPRKGKLKFHSQCGVSATTEKDSSKTADAIAATAASQLESVIKAIQDSKKD